MSSKRKRKEQARLNEQTQFTLRWPNISPKDSSAILTALTAVGQTYPASVKPMFITFGANAVRRDLETATTTTPPTITIIFIARHANQLFLRHLPFLVSHKPQVKCCGLPLSSSSLGSMFGLKSAAVIGVTLSSTTVPLLMTTLMESVQDKHVLGKDCFVNISVPNVGGEKKQCNR